eukprot:5763686-Pyramimonas_sp.AAC.1
MACSMISLLDLSIISLLLRASSYPLPLLLLLLSPLLLLTPTPWLDYVFRTICPVTLLRGGKRGGVSPSA